MHKGGKKFNKDKHLNWSVTCISDFENYCLSLRIKDNKSTSKAHLARNFAIFYHRKLVLRRNCKMKPSNNNYVKVEILIEYNSPPEQHNVKYIPEITRFRGEIT